MYQEITQLRALTSRPFGVNLFLPQPELADPATIEVYRHQLAGEAAWYETPLGDCDLGQDDNWDAKLAILLDDPVPLVSFTFGCPTAEVIDSFHRVGTRTAVTVTTPRRPAPPRRRAPTRSASRASRPAATRAPTATTPNGTAPASACSPSSPWSARRCTCR